MATITTTSVFARNIEVYNNNKRVIVNRGSSRSSKTWSILQLIYLIAQYSEKPLIISIVAETFPLLKRGCIRDFKNMLSIIGRWDDRHFNKTDSIYRINNTLIEFFSADSPSKVHGPARDILFINEAINVPYEVYRQLAVRTRKTIFLDYNPNYASWIEDKVLCRNQAELIHSTYKHNEYLTAEQVQEIESNKHDTAWWQVYGEGLVGSMEGMIFSNWEQCERMPDNPKETFFGLDFGFTNDPTALVQVSLSEGALWIDEHLYQRGLDNMDISDYITDNSITNTIIADSAEPKSISEIKRLTNCRVENAEKGKDSIKQGIETLRRYKLYITKRSTNIIKELRNYKWAQDKNGNNLNSPIDNWNHSLDAIRYVALNKFSGHKTNPKGAKATVIRF